MPKYFKWDWQRLLVTERHHEILTFVRKQNSLHSLTDRIIFTSDYSLKGKQVLYRDVMQRLCGVLLAAPAELHNAWRLTAAGCGVGGGATAGGGALLFRLQECFCF